jgi:archaellum biogenesis ATPase FlaH
MYDYNSPRYLTITDDVLVSKPIRAFDLTSLHQRMLDGADPNYRQSETVHIVNSSVPAHKSHSEEDFALCCKLVRQGKTVEEIKQAMAASELFRLKWSRPDYADRTIAAAFKEVGVVVSISRSRLKVTKASEMKNEIVNWMWKHRIVSGALNLFSGEPGSGKGTLCAYIAARVSTGTDFWDAQNPNPSSKVLMVASEENIRSMVRPKLEVAGADMENIGFLSCEDVIGESVADHDFCVEKNLSLLDEYLKATPDTRLIILDPVINHLSSIDVNKEQDIRRVLTPFKVLVEKYNVAVIMVNHFNKGTGLGLNRVGFSKAFSASTRAAWGFTKEEQTDEFLVQDIRVSNSASGNNFKFKMESKTFTAANGETDETPLAVWAGKTAKLFNDTLVVTSDPEVRKIDRAKTFLLERLKDCKPHVSETLQAEAQQKFGISHDTLYRAYNTLEGHKKPDKNKESGYKWVWQLHGQETPTVVVVDDKTDELGW